MLPPVYPELERYSIEGVFVVPALPVANNIILKSSLFFCAGVAKLSGLVTVILPTTDNVLPFQFNFGEEVPPNLNVPSFKLNCDPATEDRLEDSNTRLYCIT